MEQPKRLELEHYRVDELSIEREAEVEESTESGPARVLIDFQVFTHSQDLNRFAVGLILSTRGEEAGDWAGSANSPLDLSFRMIGFFIVSEPLPEGRMSPHLAVNGLTILYGIARGIICTAAGGWFEAPLLLPTVYFSKLVQKKLEDAR